MKVLAGSMIVAFTLLLAGASGAPAQPPDVIEKVVRQLEIKHLKGLQGVWVPELIVTTEGVEKYPVAGRTLYFEVDDPAQGEAKGVAASGSFARGEANRVVMSGSFQIEDGYLKLTAKDRSPWDLEAAKAKEKIQYRFKIDDDVLTLCYSVGKKGEPNDLAPGKGKQVVVYRRKVLPSPLDTKPEAAKR